MSLRVILPLVLLLILPAQTTGGANDEKTAEAKSSVQETETDPEREDWPGWGGPRRDFHSRGPVISEAWPAEGLKRLWERPLGGGYSGIAAVEGRLYAFYRENDDEVVVSLDAADGKTLWEHRYAATIPDKMRIGYGAGPHATPTVDQSTVFTVGVTGLFFALDAREGKVLWRRDLVGELGGTLLVRGYAASPIVDGDQVLVQLGGEGHAIVALDRKTGEQLWATDLDIKNSPSSPILIEHGGIRQLIALMTDEILSVSPEDGSLFWRHPHPVGAAYNTVTPHFSPERSELFISSAYGGGSRLLRLEKDAQGPQVRELWHSKRLKLQFTNALRVDGLIVGSSGALGARLLTALDEETGDAVWKSRDLGRSQFLRRGEQILAMEEEGRLALVRIDRKGVEILATTQLFEDRSWTLPTLVGETLYARDQEKILAVALPPASQD